MAGTSSSGGRNAISPREHLARGTYQRVRHEGLETPDPPKGRPEPPTALSGEARAEWERMADRLERSKTLSFVDDAVLYQYALLHAETEAIRLDDLVVRKLAASLKKTARKLEGIELVEAIREIVKLQFLIAKHSQQLRQGHMAVRQYLIEFGMTPAARTRVRVPAGEKAPSKLMSFMGGKASA
jgi:P27 family predicted phage terminase small subunit